MNRRHAAEIIAAVAKRSSPNRARMVIRYLNPMMKFAVGRGMLPANPWAGLHVPPPAPSRDRVLGRDEWRSLWEWSQARPYPFGAFLAVLMLSAQRLSEVAGLRWDEMNGGDLWVIPARRHKGGRRHEVPLPPRLAGIIAALPRHDEHVFSTRTGRPIAPGSKLKARIDRETGVEGWRFHDIRRTGATYIAEAGVSRFIIERTLGHADVGVTARYDRHEYQAEKRQALAVLEETVR